MGNILNKEGNGYRYPSMNRGNQTSNWSTDKRFEETSMEYLKNSPIYQELNVIETVIDKKRQLEGIDVIAEINNQQINIDVKAIASKLPTFCFEISGNVHSGQIGWLLNDELKTDYYLIVYHDVEGSSKNYRKGKQIMTLNNINETEVLLIKKSTLKDRLTQELGDLEKVVKGIRKQSLSGCSVIRFDKNLKPTKERGEMIYPTLSCGIYEQPINIVVKKEILDELAIKRWLFK